MTSKLSVILLLLGALMPSAAGYGMRLQAGALGGTLQQPTSQYYHAAYGGYLGLSSDRGTLQVRMSYLERPKFSSAGFTDQEYGGFILVGSQLTPSKGPYGVRGWVGAGQMRGYIKANAADSDLPNRTYSLYGVSFMADVFYRLGVTEASLGLQNFTGFVSQYEFDNRVAWPFNYFLLSLGVDI